MPDPHKVHTIEVNIRDLSQLFNSMDPSPFHEKDLDHDAEQFIVSWANEFPLNEPIELVIHVEEGAVNPEAQAVVSNAIHNFFAYQSKLKRRELRTLIARGRTSLMIGLLCLAVSVAAGQLLHKVDATGLSALLRESLLIGGWVAMWRPMQIFLHDWWPIRNERKLFDKLSEMEVRLRKKA
jgi:hypothetical protein